ncbi:MAG: DUF896 domain-containing protein [Ruminiclostridium sp.]|nr:DUF896 domain-containing protein [Ruminiclostridium sp.]
MEKSKIERINYLARKSKSRGLTEEEKAEQQALRDEYREGFRKNLTAQLDNTYYIDENGNKVSITRKTVKAD